MPELTREEKLKLIEKLPPRLQEFMYSEDTGAALLYLGYKYNLPDEKARLLSKLTGDVVLGITPIASLAQEINSNILPDAKLAMDLARELYSDVLAPALSPAATITPTTPRPVAPVPATMSRPAVAAPSADRYREPAAPEVVDLRKAPPVPAPKLPSVETKPPVPIPVKPIVPPPPIIPKPPIVVVPTPLIEAEPHKAPISVPVPAPLSEMPQVILRSPGLPPTDLPRDILDLRKDKGEF